MFAFVHNFVNPGCFIRAIFTGTTPIKYAARVTIVRFNVILVFYLGKHFKVICEWEKKKSKSNLNVSQGGND